MDGNELLEICQAFVTRLTIEEKVSAQNQYVAFKALCYMLEEAIRQHDGVDAVIELQGKAFEVSLRLKTREVEL